MVAWILVAGVNPLGEPISTLMFRTRSELVDPDY